MLNALTIDVEDYFMVSAFADIVKFEDWSKFESRVEQNTHKILDLLDEHEHDKGDDQKADNLVEELPVGDHRNPPLAGFGQ